ncbi:hypothetical protein [Larsenimonas rhizosphaerae]|uniref:hypothetical protein n=1 Tax=Larsenimonas rhizosphaerae TaxID=2944682 RepID=UPI002034A1E9|nr:hypothetical protein [Larsenimonas rhizosphaerae]MCM2131848.1 hypothetical protein [Larsenimonas rhizosphaerae]
MIDIENISIEFVIAGEPNSGFLSQIAFFKKAVDNCFDRHAQSHVVAYLGTLNEQEKKLGKWQSFLEDVDVRFVDSNLVRKEGYFAQAKARFEHAESSNADICILCDADTIPLGSLDYVFEKLTDTHPVAGVIAHFPPPNLFNKGLPGFMALGNRMLGMRLQTPYDFSLLDHGGEQDYIFKAPFYINHGFIAFVRESLKKFYPTYFDIRKRLSSEFGMTDFAGQVAMPLALKSMNMDGISLPMRYNFPNDSKAFILYPDEFDNIVFLHYLRENNYKRREVFSTPESFNFFMEKKLDKDDVDNFTQQAFLRVTRGKGYPF